MQHNEPVQKVSVSVLNGARLDGANVKIGNISAGAGLTITATTKTHGLFDDNITLSQIVNLDVLRKQARSLLQEIYPQDSEEKVQLSKKIEHTNIRGLTKDMDKYNLAFDLLDTIVKQLNDKRNINTLNKKPLV